MNLLCNIPVTWVQGTISLWEGRRRRPAHPDRLSGRRGAKATLCCNRSPSQISGKQVSCYLFVFLSNHVLHFPRWDVDLGVTWSLAAEPAERPFHRVSAAFFPTTYQMLRAGKSEPKMEIPPGEVTPPRKWTPPVFSHDVLALPLFHI